MDRQMANPDTYRGHYIRPVISLKDFEPADIIAFKETDSEYSNYNYAIVKRVIDEGTICVIKVTDKGRRKGTIEEVTERVCLSRVYRVEVDPSICLPPREVLGRAQTRLGNDNDYGDFGYGCEYFAMWCKTGRAYSAQQERFRALRASVAAGAGAAAGATAGGLAAAISYGAMAGAIGGPVGAFAGAAAGATIGATGAVLSVLWR